jgi:YHS domain-containing protein
VLSAHKEFSSTHKGQTYHFASAQAKEEFDLFPESYAPAYCGIDPVILKKSNQARYGRQVVIYSGKLYFFTSPETARAFLETPDAYRE